MAQKEGGRVISSTHKNILVAILYLQNNKQLLACSIHLQLQSLRIDNIVIGFDTDWIGLASTIDGQRTLYCPFSVASIKIMPRNPILAQRSALFWIFFKYTHKHTKIVAMGFCSYSVCRQWHTQFVDSNTTVVCIQAFFLSDDALIEFSRLDSQGENKRSH